MLVLIVLSLCLSLGLSLQEEKVVDSMVGVFPVELVVGFLIFPRLRVSGTGVVLFVLDVSSGGAGSGPLSV
jgi:hypothetical protein